MINMNVVKDSDLEKMEEELSSKKKAKRHEKMRLKGQEIASLWKGIILKMNQWREKFRGRHFSYVKIDVSNLGNGYRLVADVPGVMEDDLEVELSPDRIVIVCRRTGVPTVYSERMTGDARRTIWFDKKVNPKTCQTKLGGGLLEVEIDFAKIRDSDSKPNDVEKGPVRARTPESASAQKSDPVLGLKTSIRDDSLEASGADKIKKASR